MWCEGQNKISLVTCNRQMDDEEVHPRFPIFRHQDGGQHEHVTDDDEHEQSGQEDQLFSLEKRTRQTCD